MIAALAAGWRAHAALAESGRVRVVAALAASVYAHAGDTLVWLGGSRATLHPRAVLATAPPAARAGDTLGVDVSGAARWAPPPGPRDARAVAALAAGCRPLVASLDALGRPEGFAASLLAAARPAATGARLLERALPAARALAAACARDDAPAAVDAAAGLVGLGPGLTPSGDDFVGGAFFARAVLARAGAGEPSAWAAAAARLDAVAAHRTHAISRVLLADLLRGEGWEPLHALVAGLARADADAARRAAARLVGLGHCSGWNLLAGFVTGAAPGIASRADPG